MLLTGALAPPARAQDTAGSPAGFEMTHSVQQSLKRLQELWLQWLGASLQDNPAKGGETLRSLQATARQIGFVRLPDLSLGAAALALQSAGDGDSGRARRHLEAAEALDPGRPEVALAAATVARRQGAWGRALGSAWEALRRMVSPEHRGPLGVRLALWAGLVALTAAALFVAVQAMMKGSAVYGDLQRSLAARMSSGLAHALTLVVLLAPLALPGRGVWLVLVWSALLWGYGSRSERIVLAAVWVVAGSVPLAMASLERRSTLDQSPPMRAFDAFAQGRLSGSLFPNLQVLRAALPDDPGVLELTADVHRTLGQWEIARVLYRQVVARDAQATSALLNLGADSFRKGDFAAANGYFQRAADSEPPSAAAWYNLSLSFSESYQFEESRRALARAREIDGGQVDRWIQIPNPDRVLTFNGSLERRDQIAERLREVWTVSAETGDVAAAGPIARRLPPIAAGVAALLGLALHLVRRGRGYSDPAPWLGWRSSAGARVLRTLVPAVSHAELGEGGAAAANVLVLAALVTLPGLAVLAGDYASSGAVRALALSLAALGALAYLTLRLRAELVVGTD